MSGIQPAIVAEGMTKRFGAFTAVDHLDLEVNSGEVVGFIGPNGAGKSTTIRMLCGLLRPTAGHATVAGFDIVSQAEQVRAHIGYMSQRFSLYEDLTVSENLRFFAGIYRVPRSLFPERRHFAVAMAGLEGREHILVRTLAGGWKQRLALGCAILHRPPVLFLDEPTSGVEPEARRRFWDLIHHLAGERVTILVSTHYMDEAEYCNRIALIDRGRLIAFDTPTTLRRQNFSGTLVALECHPLGAGLVTLKGIKGVAEVAIFGSRLHVLLEQDGPTPAELPSLLTTHGIVAAPAEIIVPSLEDVFVRLVARRPSEKAVSE